VIAPQNRTHLTRSPCHLQKPAVKRKSHHTQKPSHAKATIRNSHSPRVTDRCSKPSNTPPKAWRKSQLRDEDTRQPAQVANAQHPAPGRPIADFAANAPTLVIKTPANHDLIAVQAGSTRLKNMICINVIAIQIELSSSK